MPDKEKVIKDLEEVRRFIECENLPAHTLKAKLVIDDAIALLKAQEPMDAIVVPNGIDRSGGWWYQCPSCKMEIKPRDRYCRSCGQAVKWDG